MAYDVTSKASFESARGWIDELKQRAPPNLVLAIAGNKVDLVAERGRQVTMEDLEGLASKLQSEGMSRPIIGETSAKTGEGVQKLFNDLAAALLAQSK